MRDRKYSGFSSYHTFGLREEWLDDFFDKGTDWFGNNTLGNIQVVSMVVWLKDAELISREDKSPTSLFSHLKGIYRSKKDAVLNAIWVNLCFNSYLVSWYVEDLPFGYCYGKKSMTEMILRRCDNCSERTIGNGISALLNLFDRSSYGCVKRLGVIEKRGNSRYVSKFGCEDLDLLSLAYYLYKRSSVESRVSFSMSDFRVDPYCSDIEDLIAGYDSFVGGDYYTPFGLCGDVFSRLLHSLQLGYGLVKIIDSDSMEFLLDEKICIYDVISLFDD